MCSPHQSSRCTAILNLGKQKRFAKHEASWRRNCRCASWYRRRKWKGRERKRRASDVISIVIASTGYFGQVCAVIVTGWCNLTSLHTHTHQDTASCTLQSWTILRTAASNRQILQTPLSQQSSLTLTFTCGLKHSFLYSVCWVVRTTPSLFQLMISGWPPDLPSYSSSFPSHAIGVTILRKSNTERQE